MHLSTYYALNSLKQASKLKLVSVEVKASRVILKVLQWLMNRGYIFSFEQTYKIPSTQIRKSSANLQPYFRIYLKYLKSGNGLLSKMEVLGKPTKLQYFSIQKLHKTQNCLILLSTPYGLISSVEAKRLNVGGLGILKLRV